MVKLEKRILAAMLFNKLELELHYLFFSNLVPVHI
jgi:hypothetical protein